LGYIDGEKVGEPEFAAISPGLVGLAVQPVNSDDTGEGLI
jgi:hypothetical protein